MKIEDIAQLLPTQPRMGMVDWAMEHFKYSDLGGEYLIFQRTSITIEPNLTVLFTYFLASSGFFAPTHCPNNVVAAVPKANPGIKLNDSAVPAKFCAATATVPKEATVLATTTEALLIANLSNIAGKEIVNTVFNSSKSNLKLSFKEICISD